MANYKCSDCNSPIKLNQKYCKQCGVELIWDTSAHQIKSEEIEGQTIDNQVRCPQCGSVSIHVDKKGYDAKSGCCGYILCGPFGFLLGQSNANKLRKTCLNCNKSWE